MDELDELHPSDKGQMQTPSLTAFSDDESKRLGENLEHDELNQKKIRDTLNNFSNLKELIALRNELERRIRKMSESEMSESEMCERPLIISSACFDTTAQVQLWDKSQKKKQHIYEPR